MMYLYYAMPALRMSNDSFFGVFRKFPVRKNPRPSFDRGIFAISKKRRVYENLYMKPEFLFPGLLFVEAASFAVSRDFCQPHVYYGYTIQNNCDHFMEAFLNGNELSK